jgi:hypothetical protein
MFGTVITIGERRANDEFTNQYNSYWLMTITLTSTGYGDIAPITSIGRVVNSFC